ncbi:accessory Sec system translocase SecA2 [Fictibacillus sp. BK138]|uniref:accessory Sec system translocase SecA2 n=1 Tax=Fictibacillus sp. BK138 TaxID=2512121 RepID=UPI00102A0D05|nr:accessory Sec system translocase SecA2 [Fictibacillus sp. BK138]RZT21536.1 preprotein translocase subunit SecA [Fictibacillus sp. BK138]
MLTFIKKAFDQQSISLKKYQKIVNEINELETDIEKLSDEELKYKTVQFKKYLAGGQSIHDIKVEAFAVVREASKRVLGMRHFDVQLLAGLILADGNVAEMPTGEGKTLVASLPSYLQALTGKGVHVITVNEYLAKRDKNTIGKIHEFLGLSVGLNLSDISIDDKKQAYNSDITYGVGNEFGFDYLRDNMVYDPQHRVQRPFHFCIIDEIDSILIDEAKTPLIIAGMTDVNAELLLVCNRLVKTFVKEEDFLFDEETKSVLITDEGITKAERFFNIENIYDLEHALIYFYLLQSLRAHIMLQLDVDYIVKDGKIELIDAFTGRILEGRKYSNALHQAIEAKENVKITEENQTHATVTLQNFFRMYPMASGMTGTAMTDANELRNVYNLDVFQVPTNKPRIRKDYDFVLFGSRKEKYDAVMTEVQKIHKNGQPILIGTSTIEQSQELAKLLEKKKIKFQLLNAKNEEQEAELISNAGQKGMITIATNMAGRGTDILLGDGVAALGGLHVIGTELHESRRIDNQLIGRAGRQGDPGSSQFFISLEDEIIKRFASEKFKKTISTISTITGEITDKKIKEEVKQVQLRCEGYNFTIRDYTLKLDENLSKQRSIIYDLRNQVIDSEDPLSIVLPFIESSIKKMVKKECPEETLPEEWPLKEISKKMNKFIPIYIISLDPKDFSSQEELIEMLLIYHSKYIKHVESFRSYFEEFDNVLKRQILMVIDHSWLQHMEAMNDLKEGIGLRGYAQEDPMKIFEKEGYELFLATHNEIKKQIATQIAQIMTNINKKETTSSR